MRIATWNIKSFNNRDQETLNELEHHRIDICALQETKKKGKGQRQYGEYLVIYSGVDKHERAKEGVALAVHKRYQNNIRECAYISSRIISIGFETKNQKLNIISVYAPEDNKPKQERESFYDQLQDTIQSLPQNQPLIVLGDFNARVGNNEIPGIKQRFNEDILNDNGELMINLCTLSEMRINNTFFDHKDQYKYTFTNSRGFKSIIDYIVTSRHLHPKQILDVRTLNSANVGSDHSLLLAKITLECTPKNRQGPSLQQQKINIESLWDTSVRKLYEKRL